MLILSSYVLLACKNAIYKYGMLGCFSERHIKFHFGLGSSISEV